MILEVHQEMLEELTELAENPTLTIESPEIVDSRFYQAIQHENTLDIWNLCPNHKVMILIGKILATSPTLKILQAGANSLGEYGPAFAEAISSSSSLEILVLETNNLGKYGPATIKALANLPKLHTINMESNNLSEHGPATAKEVVKLSSIRNIEMGSNGMSENDINLSKQIFDAHNASNDSLLLGTWGFIENEYLLKDVTHYILEKYLKHTIDYTVADSLEFSADALGNVNDCY